MARTRWPPGPVNPRPLAQVRQIRPAAPAGAVNLGPGRQMVSQDSPDGVSRIGGQAGTQAPDPTPVSSQNREAGPEALIHSLPAEYVLVVDGELAASEEHRTASSGRT